MSFWNNNSSLETYLVSQVTTGVRAKLQYALYGRNKTVIPEGNYLKLEPFGPYGL